jgi:hypothetical protein
MYDKAKALVGAALVRRHRRAFAGARPSGAVRRGGGRTLRTVKELPDTANATGTAPLAVVAQATPPDRSTLNGPSSANSRQSVPARPHPSPPFAALRLSRRGHIERSGPPSQRCKINEGNTQKARSTDAAQDNGVPVPETGSPQRAAFDLRYR